jgi:TetR/AcrR family transcriptional regulator
MGPRKKILHQDSEDTRKRILRMGEQVFAEKGYSGARVAEIADKAELDKRLIFYYFSTKQGLYAAVLEEFFKDVEPLVSELLQKRKDASMEIDMRGLMENMIDFIQRNRLPVRILFREILDGGVLLDDLIARRILPIFQGWRAFYPRLFPAFKRRSPREADHMLLTLSGIGLVYFLVEPLMGKVWQADPLDPAHLAERKRFLRKRIRDLAK